MLRTVDKGAENILQTLFSKFDATYGFWHIKRNDQFKAIEIHYPFKSV